MVQAYVKIHCNFVYICWKNGTCAPISPKIRFDIHCIAKRAAGSRQYVWKICEVKTKPNVANIFTIYTHIHLLCYSRCVFVSPLFRKNGLFARPIHNMIIFQLIRQSARVVFVDAYCFLHRMEIWKKKKITTDFWWNHFCCAYILIVVLICASFISHTKRAKTIHIFHWRIFI